MHTIPYTRGGVTFFFLLTQTHRSAHRGLQARNVRGEWIDCPPVAGTLVVAIGQGLEALTRGACRSTTHRVVSPAAGSGARYSVPFFQGVRGDASFAELEAAGACDVPRDVLALRRRADMYVKHPCLPHPAIILLVRALQRVGSPPTTCV